MPTCSVNIQPDSIAAKPVIKVPQHLQKSFPVSAFRLYHSSLAQKRSHPARNIQAFVMLAGCRDFQPLSDECPATAQPWVQGKAAFILENNGFSRTERFEFFLGSSRISSHLLPLLEDKHGWPALTDIRVDASSTGPAELSVLSRTVVVNESPESGHPSERGSIRTFGATPPDVALTGLRSSVSYGRGAPSVSSGSGHRLHPYLPLASSDLHSSESGPEPLRSSQDAAPPIPKGGWLSLCRSMHRGFFRPKPIAVLLRLYQGLMGRYSCLPV